MSEDVERAALEIATALLKACEEHGPIAPAYAARLIMPLVADAVAQAVKERESDPVVAAALDIARRWREDGTENAIADILRERAEQAEEIARLTGLVKLDAGTIRLREEEIARLHREEIPDRDREIARLNGECVRVRIEKNEEIVRLRARVDFLERHLALYEASDHLVANPGDQKMLDQLIQAAVAAERERLTLSSGADGVWLHMVAPSGLKASINLGLDKYPADSIIGRTIVELAAALVRATDG